MKRIPKPYTRNFWGKDTPEINGSCVRVSTGSDISWQPKEVKSWTRPPQQATL